MSGSCNPDTYLGIAEVVLREDLESLSRTFSVEERVELWNELRSSFKKYLLECAPSLPRDIDRIIRGKFKFAQLLLAATFKFNNEGYEEITRMFRDEEYEILRDFEEYKIFDNLDVDDIVEFIRRREGKVYELVKKYYEKQYNMLDRSWASLIGDLAYMFNTRYRDRRRKIEQAVIEYVKRYGLLTTVSEIEDAIKKIMEAGELRKRIEEEVKAKLEHELGIPVLEEKLKYLEDERNRLLRMLEELEEKYRSELASRAEIQAELEKLRREKDTIMKDYLALADKLRSVKEELERATRELRAKEEELERLSKEYTANKGVVEALQAEVETLRKTVNELSSQAEQYRRLLEAVTTEKEKVESRLQEVEAALRGESEGHLVTSEEAMGFEELLVHRILLKAGNGLEIYDPVRGRHRRISAWDEVLHYELVAPGPENKGLPRGKGVVLAKKRGLFFKKKDVVIEAVTLVHPEAYREKGWDTRPVNLAELLDLVGSRVDEAEKGNYYHILVVSSPTGFTKKALDYIGGSEFHKNFVAKHVTVYLVDPVTGTITRNPADRAAAENEELARLELPEERVEKVIRYVLSREAYGKAMQVSPASPFLRIDQIASATGEEPEIIRRALSRLEQQGYGKVKHSPSGVAAFFYNPSAIPLHE